MKTASPNGEAVFVYKGCNQTDKCGILKVPKRYMKGECIMLYLDKNAPIEERIKDLLSRMTVDEKLDQIDQDYSKIDWDKIDESVRKGGIRALFGGGAKAHNELQRYAKEHTRLGIPYFFHAEALHGLMRKDATIFPQQITLASAFEPELAYDMGRAIAVESRAKNIHEVFAPVLDLARDPRWGRTEETYGEDVYLSTKLGTAVVKGLQGEGLATDHTVASELKHYTGYGNPIGGLNCAPTTMGRHDTFSYAMPVFEEAFVEGKATDTMCSYNSIDGFPVVADHEILTEYLRGKYGMPGFVRADMTAIIMQHTAHHSAATPKEALQKAVKAGVDVQFADYSHEEYRRLMKELLEEGGITMEDLDQSVARMLRVKFMLGLFENPYIDPELEAKVVHCEAHQNKALEIAQKTAVLLKNENNLLPLSKNIKKVAVLGPNADVPVMGDYCIEPDFEPVTLLDGIKSVVSPETEILYDKGCNILGTEIKPIERWWVNAKPRPEAGIRDIDYGWTAEYFNGADFSTEPVLTRLDKEVNFNWIYHKPDEAVDSKQFCVRWTGWMHSPKNFHGRIGLSSFDSMRLWIDGELLIDGWGEDKEASQMVPFYFESGRRYDVRIEFRNDARGVRVIFGYDHGEETIDKAIALAKEADVAIVALGDSTETSGENFDRTTLDLPGKQLDFLKAIHATGTPVVLVINTGRPVSCVWENENIPAILQAGFNGEKGGLAAAQVLFGDVNPSGHLTMSYPRTVGQVPCHYARKPAGGRKYVEMDWNPLYAFGYGLSYTTFAFSNLKLSTDVIPADGELEVSLDVTNTGDRAGATVAQIYVDDHYTSVVRPIYELKGFKRVELEPGETKTVKFTLGFKELRLLDKDYNWVVEPGTFTVMAGPDAGDLPLHADFEVK